MTSNNDALACLWLDAKINSSHENIDLQQDIKRIIKNFTAFDDINAFESYVKQSTSRKIIIIVSSGFCRDVLSKMHELQKILAFYVYCQDPATVSEWAMKFRKVRAVESDQKELLSRIFNDQFSREKSNNRISIISSKYQDLEAHHAMFLWFQLFIDIILHMRHRSGDHRELVDLCKRYYSTNRDEMKILREFESQYDANKAIWWYTRDSCLYRMMNKALRDQNYEILFSFRVFITDIAQQLQKEYEDYTRTNGNRTEIKVYRGQIISHEELELMKKSEGEFLSMNSFLSTSTDPKVAEAFVGNIPSSHSTVSTIIYKISIDPRLRTKVFAAVEKISYFEKEEEVLIMLGALFKIGKVSKSKIANCWVAHLSLASEEDFQLKEIYRYMKQSIGNEMTLDTLGKLFIRMGENDLAEKFYQKMLNETQLTLSDAHLGAGWAALRKANYVGSLKHFEESLKIRKGILGEKHPSVAESYGFIGDVYGSMGQYEKALSALNKAMETQEKTLSPDSLVLAATYDMIGKVSTARKDYKKASEFFNKVLQIRTKVLPAEHPQIAAIHRNIGWLHESMKDYSKALEHYEKALMINRKTLPPTNPLVIEVSESVEAMKKEIVKLKQSRQI